MSIDIMSGRPNVSIGMKLNKSFSNSKVSLLHRYLFYLIYIVSEIRTQYVIELNNCTVNYFHTFNKNIKKNGQELSQSWYTSKRDQTRCNYKIENSIEYNMIVYIQVINHTGNKKKIIKAKQEEQQRL